MGTAFHERSSVSSLQLVQRTGNVRIALSSNMSVYHRGIHVLMTHEFLDRSNIMPCFQKMRSETIPHCVLAALEIPDFLKASFITL